MADEAWYDEKEEREAAESIKLAAGWKKV